MYICSARNIYIYLCPQIYGIAHTPCYQFVLHNFVTTKRKLGKYLIFIRPLGRVGGNLGGQARGRSLSAPLAAPTRYRGVDPRVSNTLAFCFIFFAPLAAPGSYTLPRGMSKHRAGVGGFKEN